MRAKLLGIVLTTPIAISSFASAEAISFTPDNINTEKQKSVFTSPKKEGEKSVNSTGNSTTLQLLKVQLIGI